MWETLRRMLGGKGGKETREDVFAKMGIYIIRDDHLDQRINDIKPLYTLLEEVTKLKTNSINMSPEECLDDLLQMMNSINTQIDRTTTPYWRALSNSGASTVMRAWSDIHARFVELTTTLRNWLKTVEKSEKEEDAAIITKPRMPKEVLVNALLSMIINEYISRALALVKVGWADMDVSPAWAGAIQPVIQTGFGSPIPRYDTGSVDAYSENERRKREESR